MRLATIQRGGEEISAGVTVGGVVPVGEIDGAGETDLFSLIETGWFYELLDVWNGLAKGSVEKLSESAIPFSEVEYGPPYRRPRKIWGIAA